MKYGFGVSRKEIAMDFVLEYWEILAGAALLIFAVALGTRWKGYKAKAEGIVKLLKELVELFDVVSGSLEDETVTKEETKRIIDEAKDVLEAARALLK